MNAFVLNQHGRMVFPSNIIPELDFSTMETLEQLDSVIRRDFETKAPSGTEILERVRTGGYASRYDLMRDMALNLFWANRFSITMYEKRPTRWGDLPRSRSDVFLPVLEPWEDGEAKVSGVQQAYPQLPSRWESPCEDRVFDVLFDVFANRRHHASTLPAVKPTVAEFLEQPGNLTFRLPDYDPDYPVYDYDDILDVDEDVPELTALHRWAMVLHNQYPWERSKVELAAAGEIKDDDWVVAFHPRDREVRAFLRRLRTQAPPRQAPTARESRPPVRPYPAVDVRQRFAVLPRLEALAAVHGDQACSNEDLIRNTAYNWSPMSAEEISSKTGIEQRRYSSLPLEELALQAAEAALAKAGREPEEIGAVLVATCTSSRLIPSLATYLCGQLGMHQVYAAYDIIAACAGMPYGVAEATRLLQEVERPVLVVCVEKFSDKIGNVRTSRMIFGDGAAGLVVGPAPEGTGTDFDVLKTYASGPASEVNSILWPNPEFDNNITVFGPQVKALAGRYLSQMIEEISALPHPDGVEGSLLDSVELIVPHQANKTMVIGLAERAGLSADQLYFNIEQVGNTSSASIPLAIHDAVRDGVIDAPVRVFAPGFGAGAVAGYAVMRVDPAVVAVQTASVPQDAGTTPAVREPNGSAQDSAGVQEAFG
ncbi:3-oxoacyl-[acyl-carrier-protein] synthase III C-terminal domain-containing protein [Geodermatophilus sp. DSM 44513]|uniref:3-oxoacyl-ACP synthase III family protein n=1 Tax=Geodermatophilus sp. DSM 44513 TaxID=1528104 RepID=UPI001289BE83|nr:3-oxoacyl-[acyl-carrier-protein] synthase III C-terminal domain-containing protein [Geodermatophilus sp. DSM 44513]WNV73594.1 3-oxoacyl-[acyl-carrier-protein] synthase III C-terminal domain-containing protein [Geodermatophilus sp. DSM 44513]